MFVDGGLLIDCELMIYDKKTYEWAGIIALGLFGFPELGEDPLGNTEYRVGIWKFMDYIQRVMLVWLRYSCFSENNRL